jgi:hypothetical protein
LARLLGVDVDVIYDAFDKRVCETLFDGLLSPSIVGDSNLIFRFNILCEIDQPFGCIVAPV